MGTHWNSKSVRAFARGADPIQCAQGVAAGLRELASAHGLDGPPVDVVRLAERAGVELRPSDTLADARTIVVDNRLVIEYNPARPRGRLRFSLAHELAHTTFPDVAEKARYRTRLGAIEEFADDDDWEVELLCNIVASELLMPDQAIGPLVNVETDIDFIMETRRRWDVSTEALLRRLVNASPRPMALVVTSADKRGASRVDYVQVTPSTEDEYPVNGWTHGAVLPPRAIKRPTAVGQTLRSTVMVDGRELEAQTVGVPAFPGSPHPRAMTLIDLVRPAPLNPHITYVTGDLLMIPETERNVLFAHVVSNRSRGWSRYGAASALARAFPELPGAYRGWSIADAEHLKLGNVHFASQRSRNREIGVASVVAQDGYGPGESVRLRYDALRVGLELVASHAAESGAIVHVPRIGAGQAGGRWDVIEVILKETLARRGINVTVHTLPARGQAKT
ncbi:predicted Zn peptidase [Microbacterium testaceum StLB037]|uniref:Predicted Zn peptidase n=1 Tax=Microbacterium testaceum (strain StLB037) TaxID=979556 RepID=E8NDP3_MICTS|nr:ImmA/IrrE family metallo-endopeptidase [Microbacterium testaceum]BAJ73719.1 predicted Zn peptidase [Microbacterium testaceum StLB037]